MQNTTALETGRQPTARQPRDWGATVRKTVRKPQFWFGASFLIPTLIWYWFFAYQPILIALGLSMVKYRMVNPASSPFVGLNNFRQLFNNPLLLISVRNTVTWAILMFGAMLPIALGVSLCLANLRRGRNIYQSFIFLPMVVSLVAIALLFRMLMDPDVGQFNQILESLGLPGFTWLSSSDTVMPTMVGVGVWKGLGFYVVILTAGILNIPGELQDAATVDGVNTWQRLRYLTIPLLSHTLALVMVVLVIGALQEFTGVFVMTKGGPGNSTYMLNLLIYDEAFQDMRFGTASAAALIQLVFIIMVTLIQLRLIRPSWSY